MPSAGSGKIHKFVETQPRKGRGSKAMHGQQHHAPVARCWPPERGYSVSPSTLQRVRFSYGLWSAPTWFPFRSDACYLRPQRRRCGASAEMIWAYASYVACSMALRDCLLVTGACMEAQPPNQLCAFPAAAACTAGSWTTDCRHAGQAQPLEGPAMHLKGHHMVLKSPRGQSVPATRLDVPAGGAPHSLRCMQGSIAEDQGGE